MAGQIEMVRLLLRHGARPERATATVRELGLTALRTRPDKCETCQN
jgi:hypothetical protein